MATPKPENAQHPTPPGPPGPPMHTHDDGSRCMWVRVSDMDRWRQVSPAGWDLGPCPGIPLIENDLRARDQAAPLTPEDIAELDAIEPFEWAECTCGHYYNDHDANGCFPACGCSDSGPAEQRTRPGERGNA